jgi:fructose-1,6-bisphosphatase/inositol monophosphatase family enzyme
MIVAFDAASKTEEGYRYSDYSHAACLDYASGKIFYTEKGLGKVEVYNDDGDKIADSAENSQDNSNLALTLSTDVVSTQRGGLVGYAKGNEVSPVSILPGVLDTVYKKFAIVDSGCSVFEYAMVGMGIRNGYVSAGKKQHELPLLYAFAKETGAQMVDFDGVPYDDRVYDFKGGDAEVIAGNQRVIDEVTMAVKFQRKAIEKVKEMLRESAVKGPASAKKTEERKKAGEEKGE